MMKSIVLLCFAFSLLVAKINAACVQAAGGVPQSNAGRCRSNNDCDTYLGLECSSTTRTCTCASGWGWSRIDGVCVSCESGWTLIGPSCHKSIAVATSDRNAFNQCSALGAGLISVTDPLDFQDYARQNVSPNGIYFLASWKRSESRYIWSDGSPIASNMWCSGRTVTNSQCLFFQTNGQGGACLFTDTCNRQYPTLCAKEPIYFAKK